MVFLSWKRWFPQLPAAQQRAVGPKQRICRLELEQLEDRTLLSTANFFHTSGNQLVDISGKTVRIAGLNWFGFETQNYVVHGLWARNYIDMMKQMVQLGFNTIRIPYSNDTFNPANTPNGIDFHLNPDLQGLNSLQILDKIVAGAGQVGLRIILDHHSSIHDNHASEQLWYIPGSSTYTEQAWIDNWVTLAHHFAGDATVIGADLHNEPHGEASWGDGNQTTDWQLAAERGGNSILQANPEWLIFVEGVENYGGKSYWWGGNLMGAGQHPDVLNTADRLVYSLHDYPKSVHDQAWFNAPNYPNNLPAVWDQYWGYLYRQNIAPVWVGELGSKLEIAADQEWYQSFTAYLANTSGAPAGGQGINWTWWSWNPDSGDTGGILKDDWISVNENKVQGLVPIEFTLPPTLLNGNTAPMMGASRATHAVNDNATIAPFATLVVRDPDCQLMTVIVTIGNGTHRGDFTTASSAGWTRSTSGRDVIYGRSFPMTANIGSVVQTAVRALRFQPRTNAIAPGSTEGTAFTLSLNDGIAPISTSTTRVVSRSVNDRPTGLASYYEVKLNSVLQVSTAAGVLGGATDADFGQRFRARLYRRPNAGSLQLNSDGSFRYQPPKGFVGPVAFQFRIFDGLSYSQLITVALDIRGKTALDARPH